MITPQHKNIILKRILSQNTHDYFLHPARAVARDHAKLCSLEQVSLVNSLENFTDLDSVQETKASPSQDATVSPTESSSTETESENRG